MAISGFTDPLPAPEALTLVKLHTARQVVNERVSVYADTDLQTLVWLGRGNEALAHARLRHEAKSKFDGLLTINSTLRERGQPEPSLLDEAREVASSIAYDGLRSEALRDLSRALAQAGRYEEAREVASSIEDYWWRREALSSLATALAQAKRYEGARKVASSIEGYWWRTEVLRDFAAALVQAGRFSYALAVLLGLRELNEFVRALAVWAPSFEQVKRGLSVDVLREVVRIAGWVRPDWREIHELLSASEDIQ